MWWRFRNFVRYRTKPKTINEAFKGTANMSVAYSFISFNTFLFALYLYFNKEFPDSNNASEYARLLGTGNATVIHFDGFKQVDKYDIEIEKDPEDDIENDTFAMLRKKVASKSEFDTEKEII